MKATYRHTNIVAADWRALANFYEEVFGCTPVPPSRDLSGAWLDYSATEPRAAVVANREGIAHIAFEVDDVAAATRFVLERGGSRVGRVTSAEIPGVGSLTFVYVADPEGNMVELQAWA